MDFHIIKTKKWGKWDSIFNARPLDMIDTVLTRKLIFRSFRYHSPLGRPSVIDPMLNSTGHKTRPNLGSHDNIIFLFFFNNLQSKSNSVNQIESYT